LGIELEREREREQRERAAEAAEKSSVDATSSPPSSEADDTLDHDALLDDPYGPMSQEDNLAQNLVDGSMVVGHGHPLSHAPIQHGPMGHHHDNILEDHHHHHHHHHSVYQPIDPQLMEADANTHDHNPFDLSHGHAETDFHSLLNDPDDVHDGDREMDMFVVRQHGEDGEEEMGVSAATTAGEGDTTIHGPTTRVQSRTGRDGDQEMSGVEALAAVGSAGGGGLGTMTGHMPPGLSAHVDEGELRPPDKEGDEKKEEAKEENMFDFVKDTG
jgi:hypothetical protein